MYTLRHLLFAAACLCASAAASSASSASASAPAAAGHVSNGHDAVLLLGTVVFIMCIFYLVHCRVPFLPHIPEYTWTMISTSVSIFIAVMAYQTLKDLMAMWFDLEAASAGAAAAGHGSAAAASGAVLRRLSADHGVITQKHVMVGMLEMLIWWLSISVMLISQQRSHLRMVAWSTLGGHMLGFAAIHLFGGTIGQLPYFSATPSMHILVLLIYCVTIPLLVLPIRWGVKRFLDSRFCVVVSEEQEELVVEATRECSTDFFCMGASFLICMIIRGFITFPSTGKAAGAHADGLAHTAREKAILCACAVILAVLGGIFKVIHKRIMKTMEGSSYAQYVEEVGEIFVITTLLSAAWCGLSFLSWFWLHRWAGEPVMGMLLIAVSSSLLFLISVFPISFFLYLAATAEGLGKLIKAEFLALSLMVGLSWEHLFAEALKQTGSTFEAYGLFTFVPQDYRTCFVTTVLVLIVFPAWAAFILPRHNKHLQHEYGKRTIQCWQVCCVCPCDDLEGDSDPDEDEEDWEDDEEASSLL